MSKTVLLVTLLVESLLGLSKLLLSYLEKRRGFRSKIGLSAQWELLPYDFSKVDYHLKSNVDKGASKPPKIRIPHSRHV